MGLRRRRVEHSESWTSALDRDALLAQLRERLTDLGGDPVLAGDRTLTARTGSYLATASTPNPRWPMQWTIDVGDDVPATVTVDVLDALPARVRAASHRLYLRAVRQAVAVVRAGLDGPGPRA